MRTVDLETAVADFLELGRQLQSAGSSGDEVLETLTRWYRSDRIRNAELQHDGDMLLLQWGAAKPTLVRGPTDLRKMDLRDLKFGEHEQLYLDFTRQVFVHEDEESEFDDDAIHLSIQLSFGRARDAVRGSHVWIPAPDHVERGAAEFAAVPFVRQLLHQPPEQMTVTVSYCG